MKKHSDVKEILRRNGVTTESALDNVEVIGGYYETFVMYQSGASSLIVTADSNQPDSVTIVSGSTATVSVVASGETYFFCEIDSTIVNGFEIIKSNNVVTFSGNTVVAGETTDTLDGNYYTYLGDGTLGTGWRILGLGTSGETDIDLVSIEISGSAIQETGTTQQLAVSGTYSNAEVTDVTDDVVFSSGDESVATISRTGLVTATLKAGTVTITAIYDDPLTSITLTDTFDITVS
jgi:Bacterial Ig-like domain (group 2)